MAKTGKERQAAFRERHLKETAGQGSRLDVVLHGNAHLTLKRLARHYGLSVSALLGRLAEEEQGRVLAGMTGEQQDAFFDAVTG